MTQSAGTKWTHLIFVSIDSVFDMLLIPSLGIGQNRIDLGHEVLGEFVEFRVGGQKILDQRHTLLFVVGQPGFELLEESICVVVDGVGVVIVTEIIDRSRSCGVVA